MKQLNYRGYISPEISMLKMTLEDSVCLMASNARGNGFTFGDVNQDNSYSDTDWI